MRTTGHHISVPSRSNRLSNTKISSNIDKKLYLEQKAALRVKLSFMEEEMKLKLEEHKAEFMKTEYRDCKITITKRISAKSS